MKIEYELGNKFTGFDWKYDEENCYVERISPVNGVTNVICFPITKEQYFAWRDGTLIQNAFPNLTPDEREFILTGLTADEFNKLYGEEE